MAHLNGTDDSQTLTRSGPQTAGPEEAGIVAAQDGAVVTLTIRRPQVRNALNRAATVALLRIVQRLNQDSDVRVVVLMGDGGAFCSGVDLKEREGMPPDRRYAHNRELAELGDTIAALPMPTMASIDGPAVGGGLELALACDLRLLSERAVLALPETRIGIFPAAGGSQRLTRIAGGATAKDLIYTGRRVSASEAERLGLATQVVPVKDISSATMVLAKLIAQNAPQALRYAKQAIALAMDGPLGPGLALEAAAARFLLASEDYAEGVNAFTHKRLPTFSGR